MCGSSTRYSCRRPSRRAVTIPAARSFARCWLTAGTFDPDYSASVETSYSPVASSHTRCSRLGADSMSNVAAASCASVTGRGYL